MAGRSVRYLVAPLFRAQVCAGPMCPARKTEIRSSIGRNSPHMEKSLHSKDCGDDSQCRVGNIKAANFLVFRAGQKRPRVAEMQLAISSKPYFAIKSFVRAHIGWLEH